MMRTYIKKVYYAIEAGDKAAAEAAYKEASPVIDRVAGKGLIHANKAALQAMEDIEAMYFEGGSLRFRDPSAQTTFSQEMIGVLRSSIGVTPYYSATIYLKREGMSDLILCLSPIENIETQRGGCLLSLVDPEARKYLQQEMDKFLAGEDYDQAEGYVPPSD